MGVAGLDVLDVATGTGNTAIAAARRGGHVSGPDITPQLLDIARDRAAGPEALDHAGCVPPGASGLDEIVPGQLGEQASLGGAAGCRARRAPVMPGYG